MKQLHNRTSKKEQIDIYMMINLKQKYTLKNDYYANYDHKGLLLPSESNSSDCGSNDSLHNRRNSTRRSISILEFDLIDLISHTKEKEGSPKKQSDNVDLKIPKKIEDPKSLLDYKPAQDALDKNKPLSTINSKSKSKSHFSKFATCKDTSKLKTDNKLISLPEIQIIFIDEDQKMYSQSKIDTKAINSSPISNNPEDERVIMLKDIKSSSYVSSQSIISDNKVLDSEKPSDLSFEIENTKNQHKKSDNTISRLKPFSKFKTYTVDEEIKLSTEN